MIVFNEDIIVSDGFSLAMVAVVVTFRSISAELWKGDPVLKNKE